jgi:tellurite methyltransferase
VDRLITGFHPDEDGDWVAELVCGHNQHVWHRPPFQERSWVTTPAGRAARLGTALSCPLCDRGELPAALHWVRSSPEWDEQSMPASLHRAHRLAARTWGRIRVVSGRLRFTMATEPPLQVLLGPETPEQGLPPEVPHEVGAAGPVRFVIDFFTVDDEAQHAGGRVQGAIGDPGELGGDPACSSPLVCPACGALLAQGGHRDGCPYPPA